MKKFFTLAALMLGSACVAKAGSLEQRSSTPALFTVAKPEASSAGSCWYNPNCYSDGWCRAFWECDGGPGDGEYEDESSCHAACK